MFFSGNIPDLLFNRTCMSTYYNMICHGKGYFTWYIVKLNIKDEVE